MAAYGSTALQERALDAIGDRTRRRILELLADGPRPVGELAADLPVSRPAVSQHLRVLKEARLVRDEAVGTQRRYQLDDSGLQSLRAYLEQFWDRNLRAFKSLAEQEDA